MYTYLWGKLCENPLEKTYYRARYCMNQGLVRKQAGKITHCGEKICSLFTTC